VRAPPESTRAASACSRRPRGDVRTVMSEAAHTVRGMNPSRDPQAPADLPIGPPSWTRVIGVFDLETTGVDVASDRIVTAHVGLLDARGSVILARDWIADPGVEIPESAAAIHGVTTEQARAVGAPAVDVVEQIVDVLRSLLDAGIPVVAYNAAYDFSLLAAEAARHGAIPRRSSIRSSSTRRTTATAAASGRSLPSRSTTRFSWMMLTMPRPTRSPRGGSRRRSLRASRGSSLHGWRSCTPVRSRGRGRRLRA
jgi:hypothetical protein